MRGKANGNKFIDGKYRITPAYAGKSVLGDPRCHSSRDHPRLCGEKFSIRSTKSNCPGSPPPMRGKVKYHGKGLYLHRITPAYAGKSYSTLGFQPFVRITPAYAGKRLRRQAPRCQSEDHPRLCGEKRMYTLLDLLPWGSPPPMRGKDHAGKHVALDIGITPAYAGKSKR